ncbi:MAG TPA: hypothetical protein VJ742_04985, partial [Nitrososphaera sp.]|nr:hypothetical protein [Nitrososphaera sp.]
MSRLLCIAAILVPFFGGHAAGELGYSNTDTKMLPRAHFLDFLDYTFSLNSSQIFPNATVKNSVLENQSKSQYNISSLEHELMGHRINATDVRVNVTPAR